MAQLSIVVGLVFMLAPPVLADFQAGVEAYGRGDYDTALKEFRPLAEQGYALAQNNLGGMYHNGQGVPKDYQEAAKWFRLAAEQGDAEAQFNLGEMYQRGQGVPEDDGEAIRWYRLAADQGSLFSKDAQYALGEMYSRVKGVKEDLIQAHMWFNLAAANSHFDATEARDKLIPRMTSAQVAEAKRLAREWKPKGK